MKALYHGLDFQSAADRADRTRGEVRSARAPKGSRETHGYWSEPRYWPHREYVDCVTIYDSYYDASRRAEIRAAYAKQGGSNVRR